MFKNTYITIVILLLISPLFIYGKTPSQTVLEVYKLLDRYDPSNIHLKKKINSYFLIDDIAKDAIGQNWKAMNSNQKKTYMFLMRQLLEKTIYEDTGKNIKDGKFKIKNSRFVTSYKTIVLTNILVIKTNMNVSNDFSMFKLKNNQWKVRNISIDGADIAADYNSQFNNIVRDYGFDKNDSSLFSRIRKALKEKDKESWSHLEDDEDEKKEAPVKNARRRPTLIEGA